MGIFRKTKSIFEFDIFKNEKATIYKENIDIEIKKSRYELWLNSMKEKGWKCENLTLTQDNHYLSEVHGVDSKIPIQRILSITCPAGHVMSICGLKQSGINVREFKENPMLYSVPHMFSMECGEMGDDVNIDILKLKPSGEIYMITTEYYKDISLWEGGRCKRKGERYFFNRGIVLYGMERLEFRARRPDVNVLSGDISFNLKCDIFTKRY